MEIARNCGELGRIEFSIGIVVQGATDKIGFHTAEQRLYVTDIHATILNQSGLDSRKSEILGRKRLDVDRGKPIDAIIA